MSAAPSELKKASVVGLGKLGACMAAAIASKGVPIIGVDNNDHVVDLINQGKAPVVEPSLSEMIAANKERLSATKDVREAVLNSDVTFIIVPTPSEDSGRFTLKYIESVFQTLGPALKEKKEYHLVVVSSTVLPGSCDFGLIPLLEKLSGKKAGKDFGFCYNPEFIALGDVIKGMLEPDFVLIGQVDDTSGALLEKWYKRFTSNNASAARMNLVNAELTKISVNTFVTTKITFANMLADICERIPGGNIDVVSSALGQDTRIGKKYLKGALGYGGPCFPRDNKALAFLADQVGADPKLARSTDDVNHKLAGRLAEKINKIVGPQATVAVLGLAYKPDTNVIEESQGIELIRSLLSQKQKVIGYDPLAMDNTKKVFGDQVVFTQSAKEAVSQSDVVVITTPSKEFKDLKAADFPKRDKPTVVVDCWRLLKEELNSCPTVSYVPLGVGLDSGLDRALIQLWGSQVPVK